MAPPIGLVNVVAALTPGVQNRFGMTYERDSQVLRDEMGSMMDLAIPSTGRYEIYAAYESAPHAQRWDPGNARSYKGMKSFQFQVNNLKWEVGVPVWEDDLADDRTGIAEKRALEAGSSSAELPYRVFSQIITGATDSRLLAAQPTAPDGQTIFSATGAGGIDRFGRSGGNIYTGTGVTSTSLILSDFFGVVQAFGALLDTEGLPLHSLKSLTAAGFDVMFPMEHLKLFEDTFKASQQIIIVKNVAATENVAAQTIDNTIRTGQIAVTLHPNPLMTGNDWVVSARGSNVKAVFQQTRQAAQMVTQTRENSDEARKYGVVSWSWDWRETYAVNTPYGIFQVNN